MANEFKIKKGLIINGSGSTGDETVLDIQGTQGQLFSVTDSLSGSLFAVSDISGIPILEVFSDDTVKLGTFGSEAVNVVGSELKLPSVVNAGVDTDKFLVLDSSNNVDFRTGAEVLSDIGGGGGGSSTQLKAISIPNPVAADDVTLFYTPTAITVSAVYSHIIGSTNVVYNVQFASTRNSISLTSVFTSNITLTSTAGQTNNSGFNDATIPAGNWVWLNTVSVSGTPSLFHLTVEYTQD